MLTTYKAKGVVSDVDPHAAGVATGGTIESEVLASADLIIGVGLDPVEHIPSPWPYTAPVVLLGAWPNDDSTFFGDCVAHEVTDDLASTPRGLRRNARPRTRKPRRPSGHAAKPSSGSARPNRARRPG